MDPPFNDSDDYIEDRTDRGQYLTRELISRWAGRLPQPTFVFGTYAPLDGPVPPFRGFGPVDNYPGDNPDSRMTSSGTLNPFGGAQNVTSQPEAGRYTPDNRSGSTTSYSDDSRRIDNTPFTQEEELRYRAMTTRNRDRFPDEPIWEGTPRRNEDRRRMNYAPVNNDRMRNHNRAIAEDSRARARGMDIARSRGASPPPTPMPPARLNRPKGANDPVRIIDNPDLGAAPRGADELHPSGAARFVVGLVPERTRLASLGGVVALRANPFQPSRSGSQ
ncbi:hypothetical protein C8F04DRAFT_1268246 [Mycena alexandri]|uniref:Uncharacterized protein n=1 Tax=Mycena alexandri TaxID=1745969 RepID=A0AAD6SGD3_9AGAR|nr:hypothetical protein C8F04DRAFT_1268246 [Mycena alexandri]